MGLIPACFVLMPKCSYLQGCGNSFGLREKVNLELGRSDCHFSTAAPVKKTVTPPTDWSASALW